MSTEDGDEKHRDKSWLSWAIFMTGITWQSLSRSGHTGQSTELWRGDQKLAGDSLVGAEEPAKE